ncbi:AAA family ATPase [Capnocytophaga canimorsus]|uniref:AAA family ATPase n=1 Tax=Capnocytophaga canimorsus TaxID=28188 RepID=UPI0037D95BFA
MITNELKEKIVLAVAENRKNYTNDSKHATALGIDKAQYSQVFIKGKLDKVLSDANWISIARKLQVQLKEQAPWVTVETETFQYITGQLSACQQRSISAIFCDIAGIGKTHTARVYVSKNKNAVYVDCSQVKTKQKLIRKIAQEFGVNHTGRYADVYEDLIFYIKQLENPLVILDEAGDLDYPAFLELKSIWNACEYVCGWYMMGADGLEEKINRNKNIKKVGYTEIFDRYGNKYNRVSPQADNGAIKAFHLDQIAKVSKANGADISPEKMFAKTMGSLRKVRTEIEKMRIIQTMN